MYDGIPDFVNGIQQSQATMLAAFCGHGLQRPLTVEASSGYLVIYFQVNFNQSEYSTVGVHLEGKSMSYFAFIFLLAVLGQL